MKPIIVILSFTVLFLSSQIVAQVAINNSGSQPNSKAMLDVSSTSMGILIPRMTTNQRNTFEATLTATEKGMLVFDTETNTFYFYNGTSFDQLSNGVISLLQDADGDTKIEVEQVPDQDVIRFSTAGTEYFAMGQGRLGVHNTGGSVFIGQSAGAGDDLTDNENIGIGHWSMFYNNTGENNIAVGHNSLISNLSGSSNIAIGSNSLFKNTEQSNNVAVGDSALYWNGEDAIYTYDATNNTGVGSIALRSNTTGTANTAIGAKSMYFNTTGEMNTAVGYSSLKASIWSSNNTAVGYLSLTKNEEGNNNTAVGSHSLYSTWDGTENTAIGVEALKNNFHGSHNTAVGYKSLLSNIGGRNNIAVGSEALHENENGNTNIAIGYQSLYYNNQIDDIVAIGKNALHFNGFGATSTQALYNTAIGSISQYKNKTGNSNTSLGYESLYSNVDGDNNTALGKSSLMENESGNHNTAIGSDALYNNTASGNTAIGSQSLFANTSGNQNAALGNEALVSNQGGNDNTAFGFASMLTNSAGNNNTAIGSRALNSSTGNGNVAVGFQALYSTDGHNNIAIGYKAANNLTTGSNNIIIGHDIDAPYATGSNRLNIGNLIYATGVDGIGTTYSSGNVGIGTNSPSSKLDVRGNMQLKSNSGSVYLYIDPPLNSGNSEIQFQEGNNYRGAIGYNTDDNYMYFYEGGNMVLNNGNLGIGTTSPGYRLQVGNSGDGSTARANAWNTFSDRSLKKDLVVMENPTEKLNKLHGYYYYWKEGEDQNRQVGIVAQEVEEVLPEIVSTDANGIKSVDYSKLTPLLIEALKAQQETIQHLESRINKLEDR